MHLCISGGGTAGHVYPAITVLDALGDRVSRVTWLGQAGGMEAALVTQRGLAFEPIASAPWVGAGLRARARGLVRIAHGTWGAWRWMGRERPDVTFVTGGYACVPAAVASWLRGIPLAIYLPDLRPGRAVTLLARIARRVMVTAAEAAEHLPVPQGHVAVTGYPVRTTIRRMDAAQARRTLGLRQQLPVLLVSGGSQGAIRLNDAVMEAAPQLLERLQIVHAAGALDAERVLAARDRLPETLRGRWHVTPFLDDTRMDAALVAADVALCRAGASTLGELPAAGLPALLVPLPIARGHQRHNARRMCAAGGGVEIADAELHGARLVAELEELLDEPQRLETMRRAMRGLDRPGAAERIALELLALGGEAGP